LQEGDKESWRGEVQFRSLDSVKRRVNGVYPLVSIRSVYQLRGGEVERSTQEIKWWGGGEKESRQHFLGHGMVALFHKYSY